MFTISSNCSSFLIIFVKVTTQSRVTTIRTSAARRRTCGASPNSGKMRVKRFSADPKFLANAIKMYGMKLMKNRLAGEPEEVVTEAMEIFDKENKTPRQGFEQCIVALHRRDHGRCLKYLDTKVWRISVNSENRFY